MVIYLICNIHFSKNRDNFYVPKVLNLESLSPVRSFELSEPLGTSDTVVSVSAELDDTGLLLKAEVFWYTTMGVSAFWNFILK